MKNIIESLQWRYATKSFDPTKKVSQEDLEDIMEAFRLSPSSFWIEPWKLYVVENDDIKKQLEACSYGQTQVWNCSHLLVFARVNNIDTSYIDEVLENLVKKTGTSKEHLEWYENVMKSYFQRMNQDQRNKWSDEQVYIALWVVMTVLATKWIDSCAIGGFEPNKYDETLWINQDGYASVVVLPIGYRNDDDKYASRNKVRFDTQKITQLIK